MTDPVSLRAPRLPSQTISVDEHALRNISLKLEQAFLAQMLKTSGIGEIAGPFGGGTGGNQFTSFLQQSQAEAIVASGGIGLAESIFQAMKRDLHAG